MPWLLLALGVVSLWSTLTALVRIHRPAALAFSTMVVSWITSEFPLFQVAWQVALAGVLVGFGGTDDAVGVVGLLACGLSWIGLLLVRALQHRARPSADAALLDGLGEGYLDVLPAERRVELRTKPELGLILRPLHHSRAGLTIERGLAYGDHPTRNRLTVYRPAEATRPLPVVVHIHGGGWVLGDHPTQGLPLLYRLAHHGYVGVSITYRLGPAHKFPAQLIDVKRAIAWVRRHIADHGGDPGTVILTGGSAGGHLAALAALTPNQPEYQEGFESVDTSVAACMPFYGPTDFTNRARIRTNIDSFESFLRWTVMPGPMDEVPELYDAMSPITHVHPDAPPFLIVQGAIDVLVWREENRDFADHLTAVSNQPVVYWEVPFAQHMFDTFNSRRSAVAVDTCERFAAWVVASRSTERG